MRSTHFYWNGVSSLNYGIFLTEAPEIIAPEERVTYTTVPGRSGSLAILEGDHVYEDIVLSLSCAVKDLSRLPDISAFLRGSGRLSFPDRPGGHYRGRISNQITFEQVMRGRQNRQFTLTFRLSPFWYSDEPISASLSSSGTVSNPGDLPCPTVITIACEGSGTLTVSGKKIFLTDIPGSITLDGNAMEAFSDSQNLNNHMSGDFPELLPGENAVSFSGDITEVTITADWRRLI